MFGTSGLDVETPWRAAIGYVLPRDAWGRGLATQAVVAMTGFAEDLGVIRRHALCHPENIGSVRVLAKAGFGGEGVLRRHACFPNVGFRRAAGRRALGPGSLGEGLNLG